MRFVNLTLLRRRRGLSAAELSGKSKLSIGTVRKAENGLSIRESTAMDILRALGLRMDEAIRKGRLKEA